MKKFTGKLFGRFRTPNETLEVQNVRAARAVYQGSELKDKIDIDLLIQGEGVLTLSMSTELVQKLIVEAGSAYEACHPRLHRSNPAADWADMDNG